MAAETISVTFFNDFGATAKRQESMTLQGLGELIRTTTAPSKERLPWLKLARFGDLPSEKGCLRWDGNVIDCSGVEADYDGEKVSFEEAVETAEKAGLLSIIYTSPSHCAERPRWRICCPTANELPRAQRAHMVGRLNGLYHGVFAPESWALSQSYYFGAVNNNSAHQVAVIDGTPLDELDELDEIWIGKPATKSAGNGADTTQRGAVDEEMLIEQIRTGASYHTPAIRLLGAWANRGVSLIEARQKLVTAFDAIDAADRNARWHDRVGAIPDMLGYVWGKEAEERDAQAAGAGTKPVIRVVGGELPRVVDDAEALLVASDPGLYEFGDQVVRPAIEPIKVADKKKVLGLRLVPVGAHHMAERFTRAIDFQRFDMRSNKWVSTDCPSKVVATYLERIGLWQLPKLTAITTCPVLRLDGTILDHPGFDEATGILFDPLGVEFPPVPQHPTRDQGLAALAELKLPFTEFPFVDDASRSVLWSGLLCTVSRLAFPFAPLHAFDAPAAGTGKSKLVNCCSILGNGYEAPVVSQGDDETELEKRLGALLLAGDRFISIDNCDAPLGGQLLCQIITQGLLKVRVLGLSKMVTIANSALLFATGNNFKLIGDMLRRGLIGRLDAEVERPELREFSFEDPEITLKRERAKYVVHALTVLRAYVVADRPMAVQPLGGFEEWSLLVRDALLWLGETDPVTTIDRARAEDPGRQNIEAILVQWNEIIGARRVSAKQVIEAALAVVQTQSDDAHNHLVNPEFRAALLAVAGDNDRISSKRLGHWLSANKGKVVNNRRIVADGILDGIARWRMQRWTNGKWA